MNIVPDTRIDWLKYRFHFVAFLNVPFGESALFHRRRKRRHEDLGHGYINTSV